MDKKLSNTVFTVLDENSHQSINHLKDIGAYQKIISIFEKNIDSIKLSTNEKQQLMNELNHCIERISPSLYASALSDLNIFFNSVDSYISKTTDIY